MTVLYTDIGELVTNDPANGDGGPLGIIADAALVVDGAEIVWVGRRADAPDADDRVSCGGASVIPGFVDSHTHLVFAGERSAEFAARMSGQPYEAAASRRRWPPPAPPTTRRCSQESSGSPTNCSAPASPHSRCKSGYGLTVDDEARSLRIAKAVTDETTFLGAHVVPAEFRDDRAAYIDLVTGPMLQACAPHARWVDVFCDRGAFDVDEARHILSSGMAAGLTPRLHAGQLGPSAGIRLAVELGAASVDHCTYATDDDVDALAGAAGTTVATLLPGAEFSTRARYPDAKRLIDAGATVALATDCNPGSSFTTSMPFCIAVAVRDMNFTPAQALWAATAGGAAALRRDDVGVLAAGPAGGLRPAGRAVVHPPGLPPGCATRPRCRAGGRALRSFENLETRS